MIFRYFFLLLGTLSSALFGKYDNCEFQFERYTGVCEAAVEQGVSVRYANEFLLSWKATKRDYRSLKLFSPKKIATHRKNEKRANNKLVKHVPDLVRHLKQYKAVYDYAEKKYGVNREIVAAILLKETHLGKVKPKHDAFIVFNTLLRELPANSNRNKRLIKMAKNNLVAVMKQCYKEGRVPNECRFESSYAGAVGIPQFMPQNFGHIEGYKRTRGDLSRMEDAIVSTSRFMHYNGRFKEVIDWNDLPSMPQVESAWYDYELANDNASFAHRGKDKKRQCFSCDKPALEQTREVVKKIMRYNNSSNYAVGVLRIAYDAHKAL
ncbi:MAG: lytic murein transglycosylase [Sulfurimonadaceae bacterium]|nr:lytic murein transglycosylase [Sulfurimonadaceae bacterium]